MTSDRISLIVALVLACLSVLLAVMGGGALSPIYLLVLAIFVAVIAGARLTW